MLQCSNAHDTDPVATAGRSSSQEMSSNSCLCSERDDKPHLPAKPVQLSLGNSLCCESPTRHYANERSCIPSLISNLSPDVFIDWEMQPQQDDGIEPCLGNHIAQEDQVKEIVQLIQSDSHTKTGAANPAVWTGTQPGRPARALYPFQGLEEFNELTLKAGQTFKVLADNLPGDWALAQIIDERCEGGFSTGLIPRGWFAYEREMVEPGLDGSRFLSKLAPIASAVCEPGSSRMLEFSGSVKHHQDLQVPMPEGGSTSSATLPKLCCNAPENLNSPSTDAPNIIPAVNSSLPVHRGTTALSPLCDEKEEQKPSDLSLSDELTNLWGGEGNAMKTPLQHRPSTSGDATRISPKSGFSVSAELFWPLRRSLNRLSPFVTSGAEDYLYHIPGGASSSEEVGKDRRVQDVVDQAEMHNIDVGIRGELKWRSSSASINVDVHDPYYVEASGKRLWGLPRQESFVVFQVTSRTTENAALEDHLDPQKVENYTAHFVETSIHTVSRRFMHFEALSAHLRQNYPLLGISYIPPLPVKSRTKRFDATFLFQRALELQIWLQTILRHPVLQKAAIVSAFLDLSSFPSDHVPEDEAGNFSEWEACLMSYAQEDQQTCPSTPSLSSDLSAGVRFFARTFHPEFAVDPEELTKEHDAYEAWQKHAEEGISSGSQQNAPLLNALQDMRQDALKASGSLARLGRSLLGLTSDPTQKHGSGMLGLTKAWCWKEGCQDCFGLSQALRCTGEALILIADRHDEQARSDLLRVHEMIHRVSRPYSSNRPLFDVHRSTTKAYQQAVAKQAGNPDPPACASIIESRAETVLCTLAAEMDQFHRQKEVDWSDIATTLLDSQIACYEESLNNLHRARARYQLALTDVASASSASFAEAHEWSKLLVRQAPRPPLMEPSSLLLPPSTLESLVLRPLGLAADTLMGALRHGEDWHQEPNEPSSEVK